MLPCLWWPHTGWEVKEEARDLVAVCHFLAYLLSVSGPFPIPYPMALAECRCWSRASSTCVAPTDWCWWPKSQPASLSPWQWTLQ